MSPVEELLARPTNQETKALLGPLISWLVSSKRAQSGSRLHAELPISGRRVDIALVSNRLTISSFELKLGNTARAIEQAIYNRTLFDRSFVVLGHTPDSRNIEIASSFGVGIIVASLESTRCILASPLARPDRDIRARLLRSINKSDAMFIH